MREGKVDRTKTAYEFLSYILIIFLFFEPEKPSLQRSLLLNMKVTSIGYRAVYEELVIVWVPEEPFSHGK